MGSYREWPVLRHYDRDHLGRIALPLGGIGTGTVSLGGRGDLRDWEIMNRPAKGFVPAIGSAPFFAIRTQAAGEAPRARALEGPIDRHLYEGDRGCVVHNHGLPRFRSCRFAAAYPFGQVFLTDDSMPVRVTLQAFSPLVPADADRSGIPVAVLRYVLTSTSDSPLEVTLCGTIPNFIGIDGGAAEAPGRYHPAVAGAKGNRAVYRADDRVQGVFLQSEGVDPRSAQWGTLALTTPDELPATCRTAWAALSWGDSLLDFWDDFLEDGRLEDRDIGTREASAASLAVTCSLAPHASEAVTFLLTWHFPNRYTWTPEAGSYAQPSCDDDTCAADADLIGNYYTIQFEDAWDVARKTAEALPVLEADTLSFVNAFLSSDLPDEVKEAALFNLSTLRTQTCFRTPDGRFYGWEGCCNQRGCCHGSCTHVWNYEQATAFLFGELAATMREVEFAHATDERGLMSFRVGLPLERAASLGHAAADGQMGCIMKMHRDWQLSGDDELLRSLWPDVKRALAFCWVEGGWDADRDGVMEGCQHNTMDVEYYGPNPQMAAWYLGALRAAEEMGRYLGDAAFAETCRSLFDRGRAWVEENLFNGEYYEHHIVPPSGPGAVADGLRLRMGAQDLSEPELQLGAGCLVDQLVGQFMARVTGLGDLLDREHMRTTLASIYAHNLKRGFHDHFNHMRSFVMGDEAGLLMATYPRGNRPRRPFPYFTEVMTGFEYAAAVHMLYEGMIDEGLACIRAIRERYDGQRRSPFDEAECGHHYARAMASWAAVLALSGFRYSGVTGTMTFRGTAGLHFWSTGYAWGTCQVRVPGDLAEATLQIEGGRLRLERLELTGIGAADVEADGQLSGPKTLKLTVPQ